MLRMGKRLLTGSEDSNIKMWDPAKTDACKRTFAGHTKPIICMVRVDKRIYASASRDHTIRIWDAQNPQCKQVMEGHTRSVTKLCFIPDLNQLVSGSLDKCVKVWDLNTYTEIQTMSQNAKIKHLCVVGKYNFTGLEKLKYQQDQDA